MRTYLQISASALGVVLLGASLAGCASTPHSQRGERSGSAFTAHVETAVMPEELADTFATSIAAAVVIQNEEAFGAPAALGEIPAVGTGDLASDTRPNPDLLASEFTDSLAPAAEASAEAQTDYLSESSSILADTALSVTSVTVSVDDVKAEAAESGSVKVTVDLDIARALSSGVTWEEVVPYVSIVDQASGAVTALEVHDDAWALAQPDGEPWGSDAPRASDAERNGTPSSDADLSTATNEPDVHTVLEDGTDSTEAVDSADQINGTDAAETETTIAANSAAANNTQLGATSTSQTSSLTAVNRTNAVNYATKYWKSYNPAYIRSENDCTNFISQAMFAGGWSKVSGYYTSDSVWWYTGNTALPKSYTWASAPNFYRFATKSGRVSTYKDVYSMTSGDILQYDVGAAGMNHTMIVTSKVNGEPYLTYHTGEHLNKPFHLVRQAVLAQDSTPLWYALKV